MTQQAALTTVLEQVGRDKGLSPDILKQTLEQAIISAAKKVFGSQRMMEAQFNAETGQVDLFLVCIVTSHVEVQGRDILLDDARKYGLQAEFGDELLFQIFYSEADAEKAREQEKRYGELIGLKNTVQQFGRIAAQTARQVIIQRVRDAEREQVYQEYKDRKGELITGIARRFDRGNIVVDVGKTEALLPIREQVSQENFRVGDRVQAYVVDIEREGRGPQVILSRTHKGLLEKLFEQGVPEIQEGIVRIEASAREAGSRSKIAVSSRDRDVDPVGACVGVGGTRVKNIMQELRGERIDIIAYSPDAARFVCNAIAPAEVSRVVIDAERHAMELIVPDEKLSLAIGKRGQNVRLASQLSGWRIDIHAESKIRELDQREKERLAQLTGSSEEIATTLFRLGWRSVQDVADSKVEDLIGVPGIGGEVGARQIHAAAQQFVQEEQERPATNTMNSGESNPLEEAGESSS